MPPIPAIIGPADACGDTLIYKVVPLLSGSSYTWLSKPNGGLTTFGFGSSKNASNFHPNGGIITFTVRDSLGCSATASDTVVPCCDSVTINPPTLSFADTTASAILLYIHTYYPSLYTVTHIGTTYYITPTSTIIPPIYLNGTITINLNLDFYACQLRMGANAIINVNDTKTLTINRQSHLKAGCNQMWDGIYISHLNSSLVVEGLSIIEDAKNAIVSSNGGVYLVKNSTLNKNYIGIIVNQYAPHYSGAIYRSQISCLNNSGSPTTLLYPHLGQRTSMGIELNNVTNSNPIVIGKPLALYTNTFNNMDYGIYATNSTLQIINNDFENITGPPISVSSVPITAVSVGTAICANGSSTVANNISIGGQSLGVQNTFNNCTIGVNINREMNAQIVNNTFTVASGGLGVFIYYVIPLKRGILTQYVDSNTFTNYGGALYAEFNTNDNIFAQSNRVNNPTVAMSFYENPNTITLIQKNTLIHPVTLSVGRTGINIDDIGIYGTQYTVYDNQIENFQYGIHSMGAAHLIENTNTIVFPNYPTLSATLPPVIPYYGIVAKNCPNSVIEKNSISWNHTPPANYETQFVGIRVESGYNERVFNNYITRMGGGIECVGNNLPSELKCNQMHNCYAGVYYSTTDMGNQGLPASSSNPTGVPSDNIWTASASNDIEGNNASVPSYWYGVPTF